MLLSALSVLVVAQSSSEIPEGLMNNPVCSNRNVVHYFGDFCLRVGTRLEDSGRRFVRFVEYLSVAVE